jgi:ribosomal 50S subunit-recycling heat shock protein
LATAEEQVAGERIALIEKRLGNSNDPESLALRQRAARLRGALTWRLETEYNDRLTAAYVHLSELKAPLDALNQRYDAFVRTRQAATHSYVGYDVQITRLRERAGDALQRVDMLIARQGHMIETVAINQLDARRERLVAQQTEARFGVADSYDRAARAQSGAGAH